MLDAMNMHEYVVEKLVEWKYRRPEIAAATGISIRSIEKIARREIENPGVRNVQALYDFFQSRNTTAA